MCLYEYGIGLSKLHVGYMSSYYVQSKGPRKDTKLVYMSVS